VTPMNPSVPPWGATCPAWASRVAVMAV
jgi:hypothetical protein